MPTPVRKSPDHGYKKADDAVMTGSARLIRTRPGQLRMLSRQGSHLIAWPVEKYQ
jgi:hypothetical protein